ncbi:MAG: urease accessory protein UreF [Lautropia sp.]
MTGRLATLRLLQFASPALPIGAYSYSSGLETAIERGLVADDASAQRWIEDQLELVLARFDAPIAAAAHAAAQSGDTAALADLDRLAAASRETVELRLESEQMGRSLMRWAAQVLGDTTPAGGPERLALPVAWGFAGARLGLTPDDTVTAQLWGFAENQVMVLLKAMPIGQIRGQRLLQALLPSMERAVATALALPREHWSSAAPGLAIASMRHETQYSRLFRS